LENILLLALYFRGKYGETEMKKRKLEAIGRKGTERGQWKIKEPKKQL
jgi:hypothetical protein